MFDEELQRIKQKKIQEMMRREQSAPRDAPANRAGKPIDLTDADFHQAVKQHPVMVVDFWAPWCGPCRVVSPVLEEIDAERPDLRIVQLDIDENPQTAARFQVLS